MVKVAHHSEVFGHIDGDLPQPLLIAQDLREALSLTQAVEDPLVLSKRKDRIAQVEAQVDGLLERAATFGEVR